MAFLFKFSFLLFLHLIFKYAYANYNGQWIAYAFWMPHFFDLNGMEWYGTKLILRIDIWPIRGGNQIDSIASQCIHWICSDFHFLMWTTAQWVSAPCQRISNASFIWFVIHSASNNVYWAFALIAMVDIAIAAAHCTYSLNQWSCTFIANKWKWFESAVYDPDKCYAVSVRSYN